MEDAKKNQIDYIKKQIESLDTKVKKEMPLIIEICFNENEEDNTLSFFKPDQYKGKTLKKLLQETAQEYINFYGKKKALDNEVILALSTENHIPIFINRKKITDKNNVLDYTIKTEINTDKEKLSILYLFLDMKYIHLDPGPDAVWGRTL